MKAVWAIGLASWLFGRAADAQLAWERDERQELEDSDDPDLVRAGTFATPAGSLAEGARPTVVATGDVDGDGDDDDLLLVRTRASPYPFDRRPGVVLRLRVADGWSSQVIARGVRDGLPRGEGVAPDEPWRYFTLDAPLVFGARMFPVLTRHTYNDRDPHGWWESSLIILTAPPRATGGFLIERGAGALRQVSPTRALLTSRESYQTGDDHELLVWDGRRLRTRLLAGHRAPSPR